MIAVIPLKPLIFALLFAVAFTLAPGALSSEYADGVAKDIAVTGAWIRETPPGRNLSAGFMVLSTQGTGSNLAELVAVTSPVVRVIEIHRSMVNDGLMSMERIDSITIPEAPEFAELAPGGDHLMLIDMAHAFERGDRIPLTLTFADDSYLTVNAEVRSEPPGSQDHDHGHGQSHH